MKLITIKHHQLRVTVITLSSLIQRLSSASDANRNHTLAPELLKLFEPEHIYFPQSDQELIRFSRSLGHDSKVKVTENICGNRRRHNHRQLAVSCYLVGIVITVISLCCLLSTLSDAHFRLNSVARLTRKVMSVKSQQQTVKDSALRSSYRVCLLMLPCLKVTQVRT